MTEHSGLIENCPACKEARIQRDSLRDTRLERANEEVSVDTDLVAYRLGYLATWAMREDKVLPREKVEQYWHDGFLTNVIVPFLDHIRRYKWRGYYDLANKESHYRQAKNMQILKDDALAIRRTMDILKEWRG